MTTPPRLTLEQYLAFVGGKPLEQLGPFLPVSPPVVVTQEEKDTLLATITARKQWISLVWFPFPFTLNPAPHSPFIHPSFPLTLSFQADQVPPL